VAFTSFQHLCATQRLAVTATNTNTNAEESNNNHDADAGKTMPNIVIVGGEQTEPAIFYWLK